MQDYKSLLKSTDKDAIEMYNKIASAKTLEELYNLDMKMVGSVREACIAMSLR